MSVLDYSLKLTKFSKYAPSFMSKPMDEMIRFLTGVSDDLVEECGSAMLHDNMNVSHLTVHAQQVEESRLRIKNRDSKRDKSFESGSSMGKLEIQDKPRFNERFPNQVPSNFPKACDDRVSNCKSQKGRGTTSPIKKQPCGNCGKKHWGDCLLGTENFFGCGKSCHKVTDFPNLKGQEKGSVQASCSSVENPKKNRFYALRSKGEQERSPDVVTGMLQVFFIDVYALLDLGATLSLVTPLVAR